VTTTHERNLIAAALVLALVSSGPTARAHDASSDSAAKQTDLAEIGKKLANPVSNVWALFTELDLTFEDGDINKGSDQVGGRMIFQPVMPFLLHGTGSNEWKLIARPTVPVLFSEPIPQGIDDYDHRGGLGDIQLPMLVSPLTGKWLTGVGPRRGYSRRRAATRSGVSNGASARPRSSAMRTGILRQASFRSTTSASETAAIVTTRRMVRAT